MTGEAQTRTVGFSVNGWRQTLSESLTELRDMAQDIINDDHVDKKDLENLVNDLICQSNSFNCTSIKGMDTFSDMSNVEVELLGESKGEA